MVITRKVRVVVVLVVFLTAAGLSARLWMPWCVRRVLLFGARRHFNPARVSIGPVMVTESYTLVARDIVLSNVPSLPAATVVRLDVAAVGWRGGFSWHSVDVGVEGGRIEHRGQEPILFAAQLRAGRLTARLDAAYISAAWLGGFFPAVAPRFFQGGLRAVLVRLDGTVDQAQASGQAIITDMSYAAYQCDDVPLRLSATARDVFGARRSLRANLTAENVVVRQERQPATLHLRAVLAEFVTEKPSVPQWRLRSDNAALRLYPEADPVAVWVVLDPEGYRVDIFARVVPIGAALSLVGMDAALPFNGRFDRVDMRLFGDFTQMTAAGSAMLTRLEGVGIDLRDMPLAADIRFRFPGAIPTVAGTVQTTGGGTVRRGKSAVIRLAPSRVVFTGAPENPELFLEGAATVARIPITLLVRGPLDNPTVQLRSQPPLSEVELAVMLATDQGWENMRQALQDRQFGAEAAADLIGYLFFGGAGRRLEQAFGIRDLYFRFQGTEGEFGLTRDIDSRAAVSYGVRAGTTEEGTRTAEHTVGGSVAVSEALSLEAERTVRWEQETGRSEIPEGALWLLFRKKF